ncbi:hypothetical protein AYK20_06625 [Thermoplasmatales archaeon SG8-52-1]|nr:MAG: hypothetical protein AYK20_06625 [Thermoplasmatales archaeon SG8-52-1]
MNKEKKMELTEGSIYKITSLGGRDKPLETEGIFRGFISIGVDETGLLMELNKSHGEDKSKIRIIPLHVILLVDVLSAKDDEKKDEYKGMSHYVG